MLFIGICVMITINARHLNVICFIDSCDDGAEGLEILPG